MHLLRVLPGLTLALLLLPAPAAFAAPETDAARQVESRKPGIRP
jgi:hypothetical protein